MSRGREAGGSVEGIVVNPLIMMIQPERLSLLSRIDRGRGGYELWQCLTAGKVTDRSRACADHHFIAPCSCRGLDAAELGALFSREKRLQRNGCFYARKRIEAGEVGWQGTAWALKRIHPHLFARPG
jgi:hypothetical protein